MSSPQSQECAAGADDSAVGSYAWDNPTNLPTASAEIALYSETSITSHYLHAHDFGFSIPTGATIDGIVPTFDTEIIENSPQMTSSNSVRLHDDSGWCGDDKNGVSIWATSRQTYVMTSADDDWNASLTPAKVNSEDFGIGISVNAAITSYYDYCVWKVYTVTLDVFYTASGVQLCQSRTIVF